MRIRMIFSTRGEDGKDWMAGEIHTASADFARPLVQQGRAESMEPEQIEHRDPKPPMRKPK